MKQVLHLMLTPHPQRSTVGFSFFTPEGDFVASFDPKTEKESHLSHMKMALVNLLSKVDVTVLEIETEEESEQHTNPTAE